MDTLSHFEAVSFMNALLLRLLSSHFSTYAARCLITEVDNELTIKDLRERLHSLVFREARKISRYVASRPLSDVCCCESRVSFCSAKNALIPEVDAQPINFIAHSFQVGDQSLSPLAWSPVHDPLQFFCEVLIDEPTTELSNSHPTFTLEEKRQEAGK